MSARTHEVHSGPAATRVLSVLPGLDLTVALGGTRSGRTPARSPQTTSPINRLPITADRGEIPRRKTWRHVPVPPTRAAGVSRRSECDEDALC